MRAFLVRHRLKLIDSSALLIVTLLLLFLAFEVDLFRDENGLRLRQMAIELNELLAVSTIFCSGLVIFAMRRLREARLETERRKGAEQEVRALAFQDPLTGLPNRRQFEDALRTAAEALPRAGASHALLMMDLNGFKKVNDIYGHPAGDEALIQVAGRLSAVIREGDLLARLGGDEFAIVASHLAGPEAATSLALRIIEALHAPIPAGGVEQPLGIAIGISLAPQDGTDPVELVRKADIALYRAKAEKDAHGSALRFFEPSMDSHIRERDVFTRELKEAMAAGAITPFYQPIVSLSGDRIEAFEALARWESPTLGQVEPSRFIAVAEDCGLIGLLTERLLEQACADALTWPDDVTLAFNISGVTLQDKLFALKVLKILGSTGLRASRLELEITESALVRDLDAAREILGELRKFGVRIALDDFGTGYSSLYHLRAFKPDKIKIDRTFVDAMAHDADSAAIVRSLVGLGNGLGATTTAEGVETAEQRRLLAAEGCNQGQGYLFSQAVDARDAFAMIENTHAPGSLSAGGLK